jgi:RNA polymerase sigma factor (sigma-70 family)
MCLCDPGRPSLLFKTRPVSNGRAEEFESAYSAHFHDIALYVARRVGPHEVEDVVAKVFLVAWRRFEQVPAPPEDRLWLFGVARRCVANHVRSATRALRLQLKLAHEDSSVQSVSPLSDPRIELVVVAMESLRSLDREALRLVLWDELSHAEAAVVMGCSENAFEIRYRRARNSVRVAVETPLDVTPPTSAATSHDLPFSRKGAQS